MCFGTEGNGQLVWFAENEEASVVLDAFRGQSGAFSGTVRGVNVTVIYSGNRATLFVANVSAYSDTFKCYSDESGLSRTVTATTGEFASYTVVASYPGLPRTHENIRGKALFFPIYFRECGKGLGMRLMQRILHLGTRLRTPLNTGHVTTFPRCPQ